MMLSIFYVFMYVSSLISIKMYCWIFQWIDCFSYYTFFYMEQGMDKSSHFHVWLSNWSSTIFLKTLSFLYWIAFASFTKINCIYIYFLTVFFHWFIFLSRSYLTVLNSWSQVSPPILFFYFISKWFWLF